MRAPLLIALALTGFALPLGAGTAPPIDPAATPHVGDVWILAEGVRECELLEAGPGSPAAIPAHANLYVYEGSTSLFQGVAESVTVLSWTMHTQTTSLDGTWWAAGNMDASCEGIAGGPGGLVALVDGIVLAGTEP